MPAIAPAPATLRRQRPSEPPSAGKTWSIEYQITAPIASRAAKTSAPLVTQSSSCPEPTNQIKQRRQIPHRSTPASVRTSPAVSSLEAFRTPASVHPPSPVTGRRPKTPNDSGLSRSPLERGGSVACQRQITDLVDDQQIVDIDGAVYRLFPSPDAAPSRVSWPDRRRLGDANLAHPRVSARFVRHGRSIW
jgi:hypothetical protein